MIHSFNKPVCTPGIVRCGASGNIAVTLGLPDGAITGAVSPLAPVLPSHPHLCRRGGDSARGAGQDAKVPGVRERLRSPLHGHEEVWHGMDASLPREGQV